MPTWVRQAAWDMLRGTVSWGADRAAYAPADAYCRFCRQKGDYHKDNASHFAVCPRNDAVWLAVEKTFDSAGWTPVVRRWFLLYGPETADFQRQDYDTVTWIWAAAVTIMTNVHRRHWAQPNGDEPTDTAMVAGFQAVVRQAAIAEMYAAEEWRPPAAGSMARWGLRQAQSLEAWAWRWRGIAQCCGQQVRMFHEPGYDEMEARLLVGRRRRYWGQRQRRERSA